MNRKLITPASGYGTLCNVCTSIESKNLALMLLVNSKKIVFANIQIMERHQAKL